MIFEGVYPLSLHPALNILFTGGRDSAVRVWDIRTKAQIHVLSGHKHTVCTVASQRFAPQLISGSMDRTIRTWDLRSGGKTLSVLTNHKKAVRSVAIHPKEYAFTSGAADNIKVCGFSAIFIFLKPNLGEMEFSENLKIFEEFEGFTF